MKRLFLFLLILGLELSSAQAAHKKIVLKSPDGSLSIEVALNDKGLLFYEVKKDGKTVIQPSHLGMNSEIGDFTKALKIKEISPVKTLNETYAVPAEKRAVRSFTANCRNIVLINTTHSRLLIEFRATNEGVAFRYKLKADHPIAVHAEITSFQFDPTTKAWLHPLAKARSGWCQTQPSYEEQYQYEIPVGTSSTLGEGWTFPALFTTQKDWVMITEAGLTPDYVGTHLADLSPKGEYFIHFPQKGETVHPDDPAYPVSANITSPWRVIVVGTLPTIVESQIVDDLSPAVNKNADFSWVKTGIASWSWGVLHDDATIYPVQKKFIDFAADMHWDYCLIDAYWDLKIGYDSIKVLADYAKTKNVGLILWYNSAGAWNTTDASPKNALLDRDARRKEFKRIHDIGIAGIKVDFWPGDGQSTIKYYYDMMQDAADYHLLINFHGATVPRGWSRTYPNLVSMEAVRGFEYTTFDQKDTNKAPKHLTMLPYTRNVVGPMDFTPVCFDEIIGKKRQTSNGFELALSVVLQSGVQHFVTTPEGMAKQPLYVKIFLQNLPRHWDDLKFVAGYPGKFIVMARRIGDKWYLAGINSQPDAQKVIINLQPFKTKVKSLIVITDGDTNRSFIEKNASVNDDKLELEIKPDGGFVTTL
jgi:hypothetical protein